MVRPNKISGVSQALKQTMASLNNKKENITKTPSGYTIKLANTLAEREAAYRLAYQVYLVKGYIKPNPFEWLVKKQDSNPDTATLIVLDANKKVVGTVTLIFDGTYTLPAQAIYFNEINTLRSRQEKIVEISRLVIDHDHRNSKEILVLLFNYLYIYSYFVKKYTCLAIEVNPRHTAYYEALFQFRSISIEKPCPEVQCAPAILMYRPFKNGQKEVLSLSKVTQPESKNHSLYPFFLNSEQENLVAFYLAKQFKSISEEEKTYFGFTDSTIGIKVCN